MKKKPENMSKTRSNLIPKHPRMTCPFMDTGTTPFVLPLSLRHPLLPTVPHGSR